MYRFGLKRPFLSLRKQTNVKGCWFVSPVTEPAEVSRMYTHMLPYARSSPASLGQASGCRKTPKSEFKTGG